MSYPWEENPKPLVSICTPVASPFVNLEWTMSFLKMIRTLQFPHAIYNVKGLPLPEARNGLVKLSLDAGATWIFWLDSDNIPLDPNIINVLLSREHSIISGMYFAKKYEGIYPCAFMKTDEGTMQPVRKDLTGLLPVDYVGSGAMLVHTDIYRRLEPPWYKWITEAASSKPEGFDKMSEDFYFCQRVKNELGINVMVDFSQRVAHAGSFKIDGDGSIKMTTP